MKNYIALLLLAFTFTCIATAFTADQDNDKDDRTKSFTVTKGGTLELSTNGGDIKITTWEKNEVLVKARGFNEDDDYSGVKMHQSGNMIHVETWGSCEEAHFDISLPADFNVDLRTSAGTIDIRGALSGKLTGSTSAGDIRLGNLGGEIEMHTSGGDIRAGKLKGTATLRTSGGNVSVESTSDELDVRTSGGEVTIGNVGKSLKASTSGGNVEIGDVGGDAEISTSGGNINAGKITGRASLKTAGGDVELQGATGRVIAKTSGGNVALSNINGSVEAKTAGGDVDVELFPDASGNSRLSSSGGAVKLSLPENAKASIDALIRVRPNGWSFGFTTESMKDYKIRSDFKADSYEKDREDREIRGKYTLNGGGHSISLETTNGDIEIRKISNKSEK